MEATWPEHKTRALYQVYSTSASPGTRDPLRPPLA